MFVEDLYNEVRLYMNQGQSQYFSPDDVMIALNRAQKDVYRREYVIFESSQRVTDAMRNFKKSADIDRNGELGFVLPPDYFNHTNISGLIPDITLDPIVYNEHSGKMFTDGEWLDALESELLPPTNDNLKARIIAGGIQVAPISVSKIRFYYLKKPADAVYAYDLINDKIIFKEQGSVDPEFPETSFTDLIVRTMKYLGIAMKDQIDVQAEDLVNGKA
jgi:hypothetical protein